MDSAMDMDIDFGVEDEEVAQLRAQAVAIEAQAQADAQQDAMQEIEEAPEEGEVVSNEVQPTKVHIRGLNQLTTKDVRKLVEEHYPAGVDLLAGRRAVDWVDDTSANIVFDTEEAAAEALAVLSAEEVAEPLQARQSKRLSTHPNTELLVRMAVVSDVKVKGASNYSTFYVWHPEHDPQERARRRGENRPKRRRGDDGDYRDRAYKRSRYEDDSYQRRGSTDHTPFVEDMYDDAPAGAALAARITRPDSRPDSRGSDSSHGRRRVRYDHIETDLMADKQNGRLRNRSLSPERDGDGRYGFADDQPQRQTAPPRAPRAGSNNRGARDQIKEDLFPDKQRSTPLANGNGHTNGNDRPDLFADRVSRPFTPRTQSKPDLFADRMNSASHRRQDARDLDVEQATNKIDRKPKGDLFNRITGGPAVDKSYGRLHDRPAGGDFSFKGASAQDEDGGFSIMGASRAKAENPLVKELFPMKAGGGEKKKDLFDGRIKGRGNGRRRAEDLF